MSGLRILFGHHCKSAIDRLQPWASFAWMHDNAIHDSPLDHSKRFDASNQPPAYLTTCTKLAKCSIPAHALTSGTLGITQGEYKANASTSADDRALACMPLFLLQLSDASHPTFGRMSHHKG